MEKELFDMSRYEVAEKEKNKVVCIGMTIMNIVLSVAYLLEVVKGARSIFAYIIVFVLCMGATALGWIIYVQKNKVLSFDMY